MSTVIKVFTLNCWGIPLISKDRKSRMKAIAEALVNSDYDIVCLQEVWSNYDFHIIRNKVAEVLPFSHYFYSGVVGSGVCILSKYMLKDVFFHQWAVNGYVHKLKHGDWFGGKGVGLCRLKINDFNINIYSAHLHAEYDRHFDEYKSHRILQAFDTAQFIQLTSGNADLVILAGDLNTEPGDLAYRTLVSVAGLTDAFIEAGEITSDLQSTNECIKNSYTHKSLIKSHCAGKRIDYIMYRPGTDIKVDLTKYSLPLPERIPKKSFSYSDHEAVASNLFVLKSKVATSEYDKESQKLVLNECMEVCDHAIRRLNIHKRVYWFFTIILLGFLITTFVTNAPFGYTIIYHILRVLLTAMIFFMVIMATLWNSIEKNAVVAGKCAMKITMGYLINDETNL